MIAIKPGGCRHQLSRLGRQSCEKIRDGAVESSRLMQVGRVPGIGDCHSHGTRNLARKGREVIRRREILSPPDRPPSIEAPIEGTVSGPCGR